MQFHSAWICFFRELDDDSGCESDASHNASSEEEPNNIPQKKRSKRYNGPKFEELAVRYSIISKYHAILLMSLIQF